MSKTATITTRVDEQLKAKAEKVLRKVGVTPTQLITMLLHQVVQRQGVPFDVSIPNAETQRAMRELDAGKGEIYTGSTAEVFDEIVRSRK
jgi:DNA-damage-inducible protein J